MSEPVVTEDQASQAGMYPGEASREMMEAGVFYGRKKSKTNPTMRPFIIANRGGVEIINLQKTEELLEKATAFIREKVGNGGLVLLVGTSPGAQTSITDLARRFTLPSVTVRWVGGTITNYKIIAKRVEHLKKLRTDLASGALDKYTKKERLDMEREVQRLTDLMGGLENLTKEPDLVVIVDPVLHKTALNETLKKKVPVIALANVDADPDEIAYLVPGNDKAKKSIDWFLEKVGVAIEEGVAARAKAAAAAAVASATGEQKTEKPVH